MEQKCPRIGVCSKAPDPQDANHVFRGVGYCHASCMRLVEMADFVADMKRPMVGERHDPA